MFKLSYFPLPLFLLLSAIAQVDAYHVINWLNENVKTHIIWYLEKEGRSNLELGQLIEY